ncbi:hypothetical protein Syun_007672 [Stephania yunnanensis]|uniref:Uncharacterized protein n=1 Tax=Stephania yunnanensis TaxID=152371 RepID=A0AAP0KZ09_9MAGN
MATMRPCISSSSRRVFMGSSSILGCESRENSWAKLTSCANIASVQKCVDEFEILLRTKERRRTRDRGEKNQRNKETKGEEPEITERRTRDRREKNQRSQRGENNQRSQMKEERTERSQRRKRTERSHKEQPEIAENGDQTTRDRKEKS